MSKQDTELADLTTVDQDGSTDSGGNAPETNDESTIERTTEKKEKKEETLPKGVVFEVLKNERRRRTIRYLREADDVVSLGDVSKHIAALENDKEVDQVSYAERKRVYVGLYQCHLPKMDDMNVVDFNQARGRIELTEQSDQLYPYLDDQFDERPWYRYYAGLSVVGLCLLGVAAVAALPAVPALAPVVVGFGALSVAHANEIDELPLPS